MLFCIIVTAIAGISSSVFLEMLIDEVITPGVELGFDAVKGKLTTIACIMAGIYAFGLICSFTYNRVMAIVTQGFLKHIRTDMFDRMQTFPIKYFDTHTHGDIMSYFTNDTDAIRQFVSQSLPSIVFSMSGIITLLVVMLRSSIYLTLVVLGSVAIMFVVTKIVGGKSAKYFVKQQQSIGRTEGFIEEMLNGQKVIKVFCHEEATKRDFAAVNGQLCNDMSKANGYANILMPAIGNIGHVAFVLVAIVGGALVLAGVRNLSLSGLDTAAISMGAIVAFLNMSRQFTLNFSQISMQINSVVMAGAGAARIFEFLEVQPETDEGYVTLVNAVIDEDGNITESEERTGKWAWRHPHKADGTVTYTELKGDIRLVDVDFGYVPDKLVLHDVTLYAKPGQKIAFVGATGAGKTTITNLINRFYDIEDGKIRYDGININKIKKADLRRSLGVVLQDTNLFTGTIMDNIRYGRLDATDEECVAAATLAGAHDFITRLPEGYSTMLTGDGANLSQGQKQLLSIARAAVANPPVLILDEATSSIDTRTEYLVQRGMDRLMEGRTVFVIAHRLSTIQNSDAIMVLDHGRIIERGSHEELIAKLSSTPARSSWSDPDAPQKRGAHAPRFFVPSAGEPPPLSSCARLQTESRRHCPLLSPLRRHARQKIPPDSDKNILTRCQNAL